MAKYGWNLSKFPELPAVSQFWQTKYGQAKIHMNTPEIDSVILSAVGEHWTKVAMVIVRVLDVLRPLSMMAVWQRRAIPKTGASTRFV